MFLKKVFENIQQIYRRTSLPKLLWNFIEITLRHGCSPVNLENKKGQSDGRIRLRSIVLQTLRKQPPSDVLQKYACSVLFCTLVVQHLSLKSLKNILKKSVYWQTAKDELFPRYFSRILTSGAKQLICRTPYKYKLIICRLNSCHILNFDLTAYNIIHNMDLGSSIAYGF